jgi:hypothetical protein
LAACDRARSRLLPRRAAWLLFRMIWRLVIASR